jgi:hypothetical protein
MLLAFSMIGLAQDQGHTDTVKIEGGPLVVNQSVPLSLTIVNDYEVVAYSLGFESVSLDGGFAVYDSIVYINRMADPAILGYRHVRLDDIDGIQPDSILIGGLAIPPSQPLLPGNDAIALVYFSGLSAGRMSIDSAFMPPGGQFELVNINAYPYTPILVTGPLGIVEGNPLPEISLSEESPRQAAGDNITFGVTGSSPDNFPIVLELVSLVGYDDESLMPSSEPSFGTGNPAEFSWTPNSSDIGIWQATFRVTDSAGQNAEVGTDIQVVESSIYLVEFGYSALISVSHSYGLNHGNFDDDDYPEIFSCGNGYVNSPDVELFNYDDINGLTSVFSIAENKPRVAPQIGYFDDDDYLDGLVMAIPAPEKIIEIWHGQGDNSLLATSEYAYTGYAAYGSCLGEFTGDNRLDYATVGSDEVIIFDGSTTPAFEKVLTLNLGQTSRAVNSADFNNDGYDDLAVGQVTGIQIFLNNGSGGFDAGAFYSQEYGTVDIVVTNQGSDFNGDGNFDLCISTPSVGGEYSEMVIYLGNGDGTFVQNVIRNPKGQIFGNCVGDFNNDGKLDIACVNGARQYAAIMFGNGDGTFTNELRYRIDSRNPERIDGFDIDLDGDLDMVVAANGLEPSNDLVLFTSRLDPGQYQKTSLSIESCNNAVISLVSPSGREFSRMRNTIPGSDYFRRSLDADIVLDEFAVLELVEEGAYQFKVSPKPNLPVGDQFTVEFMRGGELHRLVRNTPMNQGGYSFTVYAGEVSEVLPRPGSFVHANPPSFVWTGEGEFDFQLASDIDFTVLISDVTVPGNSYELPDALSITDTATYYWRIRQHGEGSYECLYAVNFVAGAVSSCGDTNIDGHLNVGDAVFLINMIFNGGPEPDPTCLGDANGDGKNNVGDVACIVNFVFRGGLPTVDNCCP